MSILTNIDDIPLYSTAKEALDWAKANGLRGFHTHQYNGVTGYMGGFTHYGVTSANQNTNTNNNTPPPSASPMSGSSGGSY